MKTGKTLTPWGAVRISGDRESWSVRVLIRRRPGLRLRSILDRDDCPILPVRGMGCEGNPGGPFVSPPWLRRRGRGYVLFTQSGGLDI